MKEIFVSVNGEISSLEAARDKVRLLVKNGAKGPFTVRVEAGEYRVKTLEFDERDFDTVYKADGEVIINGGLKLDPSIFRPVSEEVRLRLHGPAVEKVVAADLKSLGLTRRDWGEMCAIGTYNTAYKYDGGLTGPMWCELFVNDVRQTVARYPNEGWLYSGDPVRVGKGRETKGREKDNGIPWDQLRNPTSDIFSIDQDSAKRAASWKTLEDVWTFGYPMYGWADASSPVTRIDAEKCEMETKYVSLYGMKPHAPYYFYNVLEELDAPGEWYLDRENGIIYLYPDCDLDSSEILLSLSDDPLVKTNGSHGITFNGFTFLGTRGNAIEVRGEGITVENCVVKNVAGSAMIFYGNNMTVRGCEIKHTARGGVVFDGGDRNTLTPSGNVAENNHVHHIAEIFRTYYPAFSLGGCGNVCRNNTIHDMAHIAITFGGNDNVIEYNDISRVCLMADDSSAIYSGRNYTTQGNIVRYNYFHDMKSDADNHIGIFGMYCDDNLGSCTIEHNIFENCQSALLLHGGHDMTFRYNVVIGSCPKSTCSLSIVRYGYPETLKNGGTHLVNLKQVDWQSEIWRRRYPHLEEYLTWDPDNEQIYQHYADISGNAIIDHKPVNFNFKFDDPKLHNRMENNLELEKSPSGSLEELCEKTLPEMIEGFTPIEVKKIGSKLI